MRRSFFGYQQISDDAMTDTQSLLMQRSRLLAEGTISRGLFEFAGPILLTIVLQSLSSAVNAVWVGRYLGEAALAAVSNAHLVILLITGIALGVASAATITVAQCVGANDLNQAKAVTGTSTTFFAGTSIAVAASGLVLSKPLLIIMDTPSESLHLAVAYLKVLFFALPAIYMYVFLTSVLRGVGDGKTPFYFMSLSVAIDAVLNPVFMFGAGPLPAAGIVGPAYATIVAHTLTLGALMVHLRRSRHPLWLHKEELSLLRIDAVILRMLVARGIPMSAEVTIGSLSGALMIFLVNRCGVDTAAAFGASMQLWIYLQMPASAMGMAVATMAAMSVGGQQWDRLRRIARVGVAYSVVSTGLLVLLVYVLDARLYRLFIPAGSPALSIASHINKYVAWSFVVLSIPAVLLSIVRATGAVIAPLAIYTLTLLLVRFPIAAILLPRWDADAIWWSFPISSVFLLVFAVLYYKYGRWQATPLRI